MRLGSLFSGGGLGDFGFMAAGMEITWQVEIDEFCQKILQLRYPESKKYRDIKTLKGSDLEPIDILTGGFPCQPFSVAGQQKNQSDSRYLWPDMFRIIQELRPRWIIGENVPGILNLAFDTVCADLEAQDYQVWPIVFPSHALGAWHKRDRVWFICHAQYNGQLASKIGGSIEEGIHYITQGKKQAGKSKGSGEQWSSLAYPYAAGLQGRNGEELSECSDKWVVGEGNTPISDAVLFRSKKCQEQAARIEQCGEVYRKWWKTEPNVGRVADGCPGRVDRLKMLGNGQVPACTYVIGKMIMDIENDTKNKRSQ